MSYKTKYQLSAEAGEFSKEELEAGGDGTGGTDAFIFHSLLYPDDGSFSHASFSFDGRNGGKSLPADEIFKVWIMTAKSLTEMEDLSPAKKGLAEATFETFRAAMLGARDREEA